MKFLAHRGLWNERKNQNTIESFKKAFENNFGIETDLREFEGSICISHDIPQGEEPLLMQLIELMDETINIKHLPVALNIKSDGLIDQIKDNLKEIHKYDTFFFDMSVPDLRLYKDKGLPYYTRMSEVEIQPAWLENALGVWLDQFNSTWFDDKEIQDLLEKNKRICFVSSELHSRDPVPLWNLIKKFSKNSNISLCTDYPDKAKKFILGE